MSGQATPYSYLRSCSGCGGSSLTYAAEEVWFCRACETTRRVRFDPQPNSVVHLEGRWSGQYVVLARVGDMLTIRRLGHPAAPSSVVHVANTMATAGEAR